METTHHPPTLSPVRCPVCRRIIVEQLSGGAIRFTCPRCKDKPRFEADARTGIVTRIT